jgi:hypothetical protein
LTVRGITTDGSPRYPTILAEVGSGVRHQIGAFPVRQEIHQAVRHARAKWRKQRAATLPRRPRGRPGKDPHTPTRKGWRHKHRGTDRFEYRHRFGRHHPDAADRERLRTRTRGRGQRRVRRGIRDEVDRLFDRRGKAAPALAQLPTLRPRVRRFQQLGKSLDPLRSPTWENARGFLDDKRLPATRNAVERANRRFRQARRSISRARTTRHLEQRIARGLPREQQAEGRTRTTETLHRSRSKG